MQINPVHGGSGRLYKVLYGPQYHLYYISLSVKPSKFISLFDENLCQIRRIEVKDVVSFQRRILVTPSNEPGAAASQKDILEIHLSEDGAANIQFGLPTTQECEELCSHIQLKFGVPVYNYGSLNANFRSALAASSNARKSTASAEKKVTQGISNKYELVRDDFYASCVDDVLHNLGIQPKFFEHERSEPPAEFSSKYPVIIEGSLEEGSYVSYRSVKMAHMPQFSVYKVEWYLSRLRGSAEAFHNVPSCLGDTFYLRDFMIGLYVQLKVYKAIGRDTNRSYIFSTAIRGPIRLGSATAHSLLLNVSKDNEIHDVLITTMDFKLIAAHMGKLPYEDIKMPVTSVSTTAMETKATALNVPDHHPVNKEMLEADPINDVDKNLNRIICSTDSMCSFNSYGDDQESFIDDIDDNNERDKRLSRRDASPTQAKSKPTRRDVEEAEKNEAPSPPPAAAATTTASGDENTKEESRKMSNSQSELSAPPAKAAISNVQVPVAKQPPGYTACKDPLGGADSGAVEKKNLKNMFKNIFKKVAIPKMPPIPGKRAVASTKGNSPGPGKAPIMAKPKSVIPSAPYEQHMEIRMQNQCKGIKLWTDHLELELQWNRVQILDSSNIHMDPMPSTCRESECTLLLAYKSKNANEERVFPLSIQLASSVQRNILFHSMIFNKYRRHYYTIDQGERDLQRGLYSNVKDAYVKIWKYLGHRQTAA